jgi:hypothetical protein
MGIADDAVEVRAHGWRTLAALHGYIEAELERELSKTVQLSVVEYTVLDALARQDGWHMRMQQLARAAALSSSATTRLSPGSRTGDCSPGSCARTTGAASTPSSPGRGSGS